MAVNTSSRYSKIYQDITIPQDITYCCIYLTHQVSIYHMPHDVMQTKPYLLYTLENYITLNEEEYIF